MAQVKYSKGLTKAALVALAITVAVSAPGVSYAAYPSNDTAQTSMLQLRNLLLQKLIATLKNTIKNVSAATLKSGIKGAIGDAVSGPFNGSCGSFRQASCGAGFATSSCGAASKSCGGSLPVWLAIASDDASADESASSAIEKKAAQRMKEIYDLTVSTVQSKGGVDKIETKVKEYMMEDENATLEDKLDNQHLLMATRRKAATTAALSGFVVSHNYMKYASHTNEVYNGIRAAASASENLKSDVAANAVALTELYRQIAIMNSITASELEFKAAGHMYGNISLQGVY